MERERSSRKPSWTHLQCVIALAMILLAFWVSDVAPGQPEETHGRAATTRLAAP
ncbi:MAG TPA: hypothetical protein VGX21_23145 [Methylomirabilota bacterium]|jgi:hypothetical protein|nr:hypothetical protein [Methylomirabilota bacterium]